eukprot:gnl/Chilomastix_caulleri/2726.p1 GENE.gnl/Chilomastix_caulleri/2726~~gnl/Chilomastix_caulleri/2726.p1  ORF type:complete len:75 (-),score=2.63 gnl/Chilomastix_caulleri/2726:99-323(-)
MPNKSFRISGHSARKGAALEACVAGVPEAFIQAEGGWRDPAVCRQYMGRAWTSIDSAFRAVEARVLFEDRNGVT